jgi:hypothetical protein
MGLSATVTRKDGHQPIIFMQCGPVRHRVDAKAQAALRPFRHTVVIRPTSFLQSRGEASDKRIQFQFLYRALVEDDVRNRSICDDVIESVQAGRSPLILTERHEHLECFTDRLSGKVDHLVVLRGGSGKKVRQAVAQQLAAIPADEQRVLLGTGKYVGEGFDDARLDTLFVTLPVSWRGTIAQYVGRLHRLSEGKRDVRVYDYADLNVPMLSRMFERCCRGYEALGYEIVLPASAIPGWPADVPLPSDPLWNARLCRERAAPGARRSGPPAGRPVSGGRPARSRRRRGCQPGAQRERGVPVSPAGDARGHAKPFSPECHAGDPVRWPGSHGGRSVVRGFARVAVEIDGARHLGDADAYRRDRRKDRAAGERIYRVALSGRGSRQGSGLGARCHPSLTHRQLFCHASAVRLP